ELSRTHSISYMGRPTAGWGSINCAGAGQPGRVWQARTAPGVAMLPGEAGINVRKTARYAGKDCDPLHTAGKSVSALCLRRVDAEQISAIAVRTVCGRCDRALPDRDGSAGGAGSDSRAHGGMPVGASSGEDEDRLLQGRRQAEEIPERE